MHVHRRSLIAVSLRCGNDVDADDVDVDVNDGDDDDDDDDDNNDRRIQTRHGQGKGERRSICATDLVGGCRRCGAVVCRNCTAKALVGSKVVRRQRRLCDVCARAPLWVLLAASSTSQQQQHPLNGDEKTMKDREEEKDEEQEEGYRSFTYPAFARGACECPMFFWLCQPCGQFLQVHDTDYLRIWTWRIRYSTYLGGLGTGIGEGHEGVKCGRGGGCLAARKIEVEEDCSVETMAGVSREGASASAPVSQDSGLDTSDYDLDKAGYFRQEVEGIGGLMRGKVKRMVVVGKTVQEHEDERENGDYLSREARGLSRSWCSWCERVVLSLKDKKQMT